MSDTLEPCPFCGERAIMRKDDDPGYPWYVTFDHADSCPMYAVPTDLFRSYPTEAEAVIAWNTRTPPPPSQRREPIEADREALVEMIAAIIDPDAMKSLEAREAYWREYAMTVRIEPGPRPIDREVVAKSCAQSGWDDDKGRRRVATDKARAILDRLAFSTPAASDAEGWRPYIGQEVRPTSHIIEKWPDWREVRLWVVGIAKDRIGNQYPVDGINITVSDEWPVTSKTGGFTDGFYIGRQFDADDLEPVANALPLFTTPSTEGRNGEDCNCGLEDALERHQAGLGKGGERG